MAASWQGAHRASKGDIVPGQVSARCGAGGLAIYFLHLCQPLEALLGFQGGASSGTNLDAIIVAKEAHPLPDQLIGITASQGRGRLPTPLPLAKDGSEAATRQRPAPKRMTTSAREAFEGSNVGDDGGWLLAAGAIHAHWEGDLVDRWIS